LNILIIGGTRFLGRHLVASALARGHEVTLFNRGQSNPGLFQQVETILGDREKDLNLLTNRRWDMVVDTCGYVPRMVGLSARALREAVEHYVFISSISVYADFSKIGITEEDAVGKLDDESVEEITGETYGPLKALCEKVVESAFPDRALILRPGLIVGAYDPTDRFTYWPVRVAIGGEILAPEGPQAPVQIIDARDLVDFTFRLMERRATGIYHATGPDYPLTLGEVLRTSQEISGSAINIHWALPEFLTRHKVEPWSDLPVWFPDTAENLGFSRVDVSKAIAAGLTFRPLAETVRDTLDWASTRPLDYEWHAGLDPEREAKLIKSLEG
jgi:2'-hydroxyisoflavone reductase